MLLQRVNTSTSFASAHVFPGGHVDAQDGPIPPTSDLTRHEDSSAYRLAAIRECFEESGILLAKSNSDAANNGNLIDLEQPQRDAGRKAVHSQDIPFGDWLTGHNAHADTEALIPFTRWLTPARIPKRYSTQMYIYFLPLDAPLQDAHQTKQIHIPTADGGIEHTAAQFLYAQEWIDLALRKEIVLFPPQFFLLALIAPFLSSPPSESELHSDNQTLLQQRERLKEWVENDGDPPWGEKCISPDAIKRVRGQYMIMGLADPGPELEGTERKGDTERVLKVELDKEIERGRERPRPVGVFWRRDVLGDEGGKAKI